MTRHYVKLSFIWDRMSEENRAKALGDMPNIKGLFCYAFPYLAEKAEGNISLYAVGLDYHKVVGERLEAYCRELKKRYPKSRFLPYVDVSPFPEAYAAAMSGLGKLGKNGLLITEKYGSFVFVGVIATDLEKEGGERLEYCRGCGACLAACPGKAIRDDGFNIKGCLSDITQRRGELTSGEKALMRENKAFWGCDICQLVCPENAEAEQTDITEFKNDLICSLSSEDLQGSNREIQRKYHNRAFIWRGAAVLKRNAEILENRGEDNG